MQRIATSAVLFALAACRTSDERAHEPLAEAVAKTESVTETAQAEEQAEVRLLWEREDPLKHDEPLPSYLRVMPVADLNRDGARDLLVTVERIFGSARVLALSGKDGATLWEFECPEHRGPGDACWLGHEPCTLSDIDGDGVVDLALADPGPHYLDGWSPPTSINLISGASGEVLARTVDGGPTSERHCRFGLSMANVDDVDDDGLSEIAAFGTSGGRDEPFIEVLSAADCVRMWRAPACFDGWGVDLFTIADCDGDGLRDIAEVRNAGADHGAPPAVCAHSSRNGALLHPSNRGVLAALSRLVAELNIRATRRTLEPSLEEFVALDTTMRAAQSAPFKPKPRHASLESAGFVGDLDGDGSVEFWTRWDRSTALFLGSVRRSQHAEARY